jgi:lipid-A-disaccharide synthase
LLVGNDLFNCLLARRLRRAGVRTFAWFPPQVWLWRSQVRPIARSYDRILTSFPEEHEVYRRAGGQTEFVGHYLRDLLTTAGENERRSARAALGLAEDDAPVVAVLPGSRTVEVRELGPLLFAAAARLAAHSPRLRFLVPAAEPGYLERIRSQIAASGLAGAQLFLGRSREALAAADVALMASGTASLEAALLGTPMVLTYRLSRVTDASVRLLRWIGWIEDEMVGLPNLLLGRRAVPELRQEHANAEELAVAVGELLERTELRAAMRGELAQIAPLLAGERGGGAAAAVAEALLAEHPAEQSVAEGAVDGAPRWAAS